MRKQNTLIALTLSIILCTLCNNAFAKFVVIDEVKLQGVKQSLSGNQTPLLLHQAYTQLITDADKALKGSNYSVMDKKIAPPTNDNHDYLSISRYWWPDESKPDGLPWKRRDGITNPDTQTDQVDRKRLGSMAQSVRALSLAYYLSDNDRYAKKATDLIKTWFLDPKTKMNPHLNFAQSVPGIDKNRRSGILDGRLISLHILDSIQMLSSSTHWRTEDNKRMDLWLNNYLTWLTTSSLGKAGAKQTNNHGAWYFFQVSALSWYLDDSKTLKKAMSNTERLIQNQFDSEGAQHHELERTRPYFYSNFNLQALTSVAIISEHIQQPLWAYPSSNSSILNKGVEFLIPAAQGEQWQYSSKSIRTSDLIAVLARYLERNNNPQYSELLQQLVVRELAKNTSKVPGNIQYLLLQGIIIPQ